MLIGVPKEIKTEEHRVALTPTSVRELTRRGHTVWVETNAGAGIASDDAAYKKVGANIAANAGVIFESCDMIVKVKEPQPSECRMMHRNQILFTYLHLAADKPQALALCESGVTAIAYETVTDARGRLPLLQPMSRIAGRMSIQVGARCLEKSANGRGVLLGGVPGVPPARVVILGAGVAGTNALQMAVGMHADVEIFDTVLDRLAEIEELYQGRVRTLHATGTDIENAVLQADLVIGAVLIPGASAPRLVTREMLPQMKDGSVLVDISIDQGGCFATSKPTTHTNPFYSIDGVVHYCVANMPGAVSRTSSFALNSAILPYVTQLADRGLDACCDNPHLGNGLNVFEGSICCDSVASSLDMPLKKPAWLL